MAVKSEKTKHTGRTVALVAVAVCLIFALAVTASAYRNGAYAADDKISLSEFFDIAFGTGVAGQDAYGVEIYGSDGSLLKTEHYPNIQRVEADQEIAERLLGDRIKYISEALLFNGYTLTVHGYAIDKNGIGILSFELENKDGTGLSTWFSDVDEDGKIPVHMELRDSEGQGYDMTCYAEESSFSDTHALYIAYLTPFFSYNGEPLTLKVLWDGKEKGEISYTLECDELIPVRQFSSSGVNVKVSPLGFVTDTDISACTEKIAIRYKDGSEYLVESDNNHNIASSSLLDDTVGVADTFNRVVDVNNIAEFSIDLK